jgi:hypothetical protein
VWYDLAASVAGQLVLVILAIWLVIWLLIAVPLIFRRQKLTGTARAAWDVALPFGALAGIIIIGRAILEWSVR